MSLHFKKTGPVMNKFKNGILWVIYPTNVKIPLATMKSENIVSYNVK